MNLFCADVGTSSIKAGLVSPEGKLLSFSRAVFPPVEGGEFPAAHWVEAFAKAVLETGGRDADGIVISGQGPSLAALGADGKPVTAVLSWNDGKNVRIPGEPSFFLPKIAWLRDHQPEIFRSVRLFLSCPEFLSFILTGEPFMFIPSDQFIPYVWTPGAVTRYGLDPCTLPPFLHTGERAGCVGAASAARMGLRAGTPVFAGGSDFLMALLGTATVRPGRVCDRAGTSEGINFCSATPISGDRVRCLPHAIPGLYNVAGILSSTGKLFEWFRAVSGQTDRPYADMLEEIRRIAFEQKSPVFFPTLHEGAAWEFSRGVFFDLGAAHGKAEMGRAVVESIGFAVREAVEILSSHAGAIGELRVTGGQAKNAVWNQMKSDITGVRIVVPETEDAELTGNACAGYRGLGHFSSLTEASETLFRVRRVIEPDAELHARYSESYARYLELYGRIRAALRYYGHRSGTDIGAVP